MEGITKAELEVGKFKEALSQHLVSDPFETHRVATTIARDILAKTKDFTNLGEFVSIPTEGLIESYRKLMDSLSLVDTGSAATKQISRAVATLRSNAEQSDIMALEDIEEEVIL